MNTDLLNALIHCETDVDGAIGRLAGNELLYLECLDAFLDDTTMEDLTRAIQQQAWDEAFTAAHALKGLAGNMGFIPLFHATGELVVKIRAGRIIEIGAAENVMRRCYQEIVSAIRMHYHAAESEMKGERT